MSGVRRYVLWSSLGAVLALSGCGGGGSSTVGSSLVVESLKLTPGNVWSTGSVQDDGLVIGKQGSSGLAQVDCFWPSPGQIITIPNIDSKAVYQNLSGLSTDQKSVLGYTIDVDNSYGPGRAFAYSRSSGEFQVLQIASSAENSPYPESFLPNGTVIGWTQAPNNFGIGGQRFVYNLTNNTYTLTTPSYNSGNPTFPLGTTNQGSCSSPSGRFIGGNIVSGSHNQAAIWDTQGKTYRLIGPKDKGYQATAVNDTGTVATVNSDQIGLPYYLLQGNKLTDLIALCQSKGIGSNWLWLNFISLSPSGNYLTFTGENYGGFGSAVRIRIP